MIAVSPAITRPGNGKSLCQRFLCGSTPGFARKLFKLLRGKIDDALAHGLIFTPGGRLFTSATKNTLIKSIDYRIAPFAARHRIVRSGGKSAWKSGSN
jgi:hypothetical protein